MPMSTLPSPTQKTLFIVGAGASAEVGLPIGSELKKRIASALSYEIQRGWELVRGDEIILNALRALAELSAPPESIDAYIRAAHRTRDAMPQVISIDNFLDQHSDDKHIKECGKLAIVRTILKAEASSLLFINPSNIHNKMRFDGLEDKWYGHLWKLITENCNRAGLKERFSSIAFIIFNYDRCIEHYLFHSLQNNYSISPEKAAEIVGCIEIYHPYGIVGELPWRSQQNSIGYGGTPDARQLRELAGQIKTFTEGTDIASSHVSAIRGCMMMARRIIYLGFAYHKLNMELLTPTPNTLSVSPHLEIFGTALGESESNNTVIRSVVADGKIHPQNARIRDMECSELFREYSRSLSFV